MNQKYQATITPNVSGGNITVVIYANNTTQARELIKKLPYFKSFVSSPIVVKESATDDYDDLFGIEI